MIIDERIVVVGFVHEAGDIVVFEFGPGVSGENIQLICKTLLVASLQRVIGGGAGINAVFGQRSKLRECRLEEMLRDGGEAPSVVFVGSCPKRDSEPGYSVLR